MGAATTHCYALLNVNLKMQSTCPLFLLNPKLSVAACVPSLGTISRSGSGWYAPCIALRMDTMLTAPGLTLLFLGVVVGLGTAFVWLLWEIEQMSKPPRNSDRFG